MKQLRNTERPRGTPFYTVPDSTTSVVGVKALNRRFSQAKNPGLDTLLPFVVLGHNAEELIPSTANGLRT